VQLRRASNRGTVRVRSHRFVLPDVTVVEPARHRLPHVDVVVREGRIATIGATAAQTRDPDLEVLEEYAGCFVLPGLIDMHGHLPPDNLLDLGGQFALLHLAHGVTSVRDAGDMDGTGVDAVRRGMAAGRFDGPRLFCAGPFVCAGRPRWPNSIVVQSAADAEAVATRLRAHGNHSIKLYENLTVEMIRALVDAAQRCGLGALGHVPTALGFETACLPDAQHFFGVPPPASLRRDHVFSRAADWWAVTNERMQVVVEAAVNHNLANTPTLVATERLLEYDRYAEATRDASYALLPRLYRTIIWHPVRGIPAYRGLDSEDFSRLRDAFAKKLRLTKMLFDAGAHLHLGTDVQQPFVVPGAALLEEMRLFVRAGIPSDEVWRLATRGAAEYLSEDDLGTVRENALADLGVYALDPTVDLGRCATLRAVVVGGRLLDKAAVEARLAAEREAHEGFFFEHVAPLLARLALWRTARNFAG
jgi:hypothetical protein